MALSNIMQERVFISCIPDIWYLKGLNFVAVRERA